MSRVTLVLLLLLGLFSLTVAKVEMIQGENKIDVLIDGKMVTSYLYQPDLTKPVLFPVKTLAGVAINRGFPLQIVAGESKDHPHHFGIFFTYDKVNQEGFWGNTRIPPQIKLAKIEKVKSGKIGKIKAMHHWLAKTGKTLLEEKRTMLFSAGENYYTIDFAIKLTAKDTAVVFRDTKEGMFAIRVADWLAEKNGNAEYLSSNGERMEKEIWGKRAEWVRLQGSYEGKKLGIVMINHPTSVNYPTFWHSRAYGLFSAGPLGQQEFERERKVEQPKAFNLTLAKGESAWFKFRVVVYDGDMDKVTIDALAAEYKTKK